MVRYFLCSLLAISFGLYAGDTHQGADKNLYDSSLQHASDGESSTLQTFFLADIIYTDKDYGACEHVIPGNYHQTDGTLMLRIVKKLHEKMGTKLNADGDEITMINPSYSYASDSIRVQGTAQLGGHVALEMSDGMLIKDGTTFTILTAQKIEGKFDSISPSKCILRPILDYSSPTSVQVKFVAGHYSGLEYKDEKVKDAALLLDKARNDDILREKFASLFLALDRTKKKRVEQQIKILIMPSPAFKKLTEYKFEADL